MSNKTSENEAVNLKVGDIVTYVVYKAGYVDYTISEKVVSDYRRGGLVINSPLFLTLNKLSLFELSDCKQRLTYRVLEVDRKKTLVQLIKNLLSFKQ